MDEWLAQVYGTNGAGAGNDLEKTAQAMMLEKLAEQEGIDISGLSPEQLDALAQQVVSSNAGAPAAQQAQPQAGAAPEAGAPSAEEEAQAKFAEADFLGRVMAHSYTQELQKIAQEGGGFPPAATAEEKEEKCEKCGKTNCTCPAAEKTAQGPLAQAITAMGGQVVPPQQAQQQAPAQQAAPAQQPGMQVPAGTSAAEYVEKLAEARAQELAIGWLQQNGYIK